MGNECGARGGIRRGSANYPSSTDQGSVTAGRRARTPAEVGRRPKRPAADPLRGRGRGGATTWGGGGEWGMSAERGGGFDEARRTTPQARIKGPSRQDGVQERRLNSGGGSSASRLNRLAANPRRGDAARSLPP